MHKEKAPSHTNLSASERGGAQYEGAVSGYKVKDLIHNTQAGDRKLLGLDENSRTRFSLPDDVKLTKRERELRDGLIEKVSRAVGAENVITDVETSQRVLDLVNGVVALSRGKKRALETASVSQEEEHPADISSTDGAKLQKVSDSSKEETDKIFAAAKKKFGITHDLREAGYVLPDGSMLDFSGRHTLDKGADSSFLNGQRTTDHRNISSIAYEYDAEGNEIETGIETNMSDFIRRGAIRIDSYGTINLSVKPTPER